MKRFLLLFFTSIIFFQASAQQSVARQWNEATLSAIRGDLARPPVQARNLFHVSVAMYDAWAAYDIMATTYLIGKTVNGNFYPYSGIPPGAPANVPDARKKAISYAAYRVLVKRYSTSPHATEAMQLFRNLMNTLGYDTSYTATNYAGGNPADLGNFIGAQVIQMGLVDGARENQNYGSSTYSPVNPFLHTDSSGNRTMIDPNRWQPLYINTALDQNGNPVGSLQNFVCPEWGSVGCFTLANPVNHVRDGHTYPVFMDPGTPPMLDTLNVNDSSSYYFKKGHEMVSVWSSHLSPDDNVMWDISPNAIGNVQSLPTTRSGQLNFYNFLQGGDAGTGYTVNPKTNNSYTPQIVKRGDYTRVITQYWADGPASETPPGHWYVLLNEISDDPQFEKRYEGVGPLLDNLEWDVKAYFTLGGAEHDAAIACWGIKGWYDAPRPISMIRKMAEYGQSSDPLLPSYHPAGIPLVPGNVELIYAGDPLAGINNINVGKIKLKSWRGFNFITNPATDHAGVGWILAKNWLPYQRKTFVTPPFAGYVSGHSTYSRAAAEVLTALTGDPFFPGGIHQFVVPANSTYIGLEAGPTTEIRLQWATYRDASDQSSLSRIWGGIHPPFDDIPGRLIGKQIGIASHAKAKTYFFSNVVSVLLTSYTVSENNCTINIKWTSATEENTKMFKILKSNDGIRFQQIAILNAAGNSTSLKSYSFTDEYPSTNNFYKLVATGLNGRETVFETRQVAIQHCAALNNFVNIRPNPVQSQATAEFVNNNNYKNFEIILLDISGKKILSQKGTLHAGNNQVILRTEALMPGIYPVKILMDGAEMSVQKLIKL
ncbi:MAG: DUF6851 domain-containing protein [Ferruginibacter sp.]